MGSKKVYWCDRCKKDITKKEMNRNFSGYCVKCQKEWEKLHKEWLGSYEGDRQ